MLEDMTFEELDNTIYGALGKMWTIWESMSDSFKGKKIELYNKEGGKDIYLINSVEMSDRCELHLDISPIDDVFNSKWVEYKDIEVRFVRIFV